MNIKNGQRFAVILICAVCMCLSISADDYSGDNRRVYREVNWMKIEANGCFLTAVLEVNSTTVELKKMLNAGPITIQMKDYGNMEKVGNFDRSLPRNDEQIRTEAGDLILYNGRAFVIYYDTNSWNFTRIGRIEGYSGEELKGILGAGDVMVTLSFGQN